MMLHIIGYLLPLFLAAIALPMALGKVPPNRWYGFRTPKTLSSPEIWYPANRVSGWYMIYAQSLTICFNVSLWLIHPDWPQNKLAFWMCNAMSASVLLALIPSILYLRRL